MNKAIYVSFILINCANVSNDDSQCSLSDHAKQYLVTYEKVNGNCGELEPSLAYTPLLNVADCNLVKENYESCTYSFTMECVEGSNVHTAEFSSIIKPGEPMTGTAKFSGYPCVGEYKTTLTPVGM